MNETPFYIEFIVNDLERFDLLKKVFNELKGSKETNSFNEDDYYLNFFDEKAKAYFGTYSDEENLEWSEKWFSTPVEERWNNPDLQRKWDFGSMIEAFKNGEYELLSCEMVTEDKGRINYDPWAYPFGGTGCMKALAESFGFEVTREDWEE
jgi:hypothetical protein